MTEREWLDNGPDRGVLVLANELLDAFPVHWVEYEQGTYEEIYVAWNEAEKRFYEKKLPIAAGPLLDYLQEELPAPEEGQRLEVNLEALEWTSRVTSKLQQGQVMVVDYGDESHELYAPHRMRGTLICYRNHQAAEQPYAYQGEQDITAHVNFTACRRAGLEAGAQQAVLCNQREFLLQQGILDRLQETFGLDPFGPEAKRNRAIRQLLLSDQMSELFKVLILKKA
jgi:SAM-dependent MidA family methyltransferase